MPIGGDMSTEVSRSSDSSDSEADLRTLHAVTADDVADFHSPHLGLALRRLTAEFIGVFFLMLVACGAVMIADKYPKSISVAVSGAAAGLVIIALVLAFGRISGAHFNPAITIAYAIRGAFPYRRVPAYQVLFWEALLTFGLITVLLAVVNGAMASMNPARAFGPALVSGYWADVWAYLVGPMIGVVLPVALARFLRGNVTDPKQTVLTAQSAQGEVSAVLQKKSDPSGDVM
jgi:aquaporin Z